MTKGNKNQLSQNNFTEFLLYRSPNGAVKVEIFLKNENIWLTQEKIASLFGVDRSVITKHLKNIFESGELDKEATCAKFAQVRDEGRRSVNREIEFYNLDAIISVGYRVNSIQATNFRIWATERLKEYIIKGFTMDDERLKDPRKILDALLDKYANQGVVHIEDTNILAVNPFDSIGSPIEIIQQFGRRNAYFLAVRELEREIYAY